MLLSQYLTTTAQLLQDPQATSALFSTADLTSYINQARTFLAGDTECVRANGTATVLANIVFLPFTKITIPGAGYGAPLYLRNILLTGVGGTIYPVFSRTYPWFALYNLTGAPSPPGIPREWAQQGQGDLGTFYLSPPPLTAMTATIDLVAFPTPLVSDLTPDVIPNPFSLAVPYYAAYLAYLQAQRTQDAQSMFTLYRQYAESARTFVNGSVLSYQGAQPRDPAATGRFGQSSRAGGG